MELYGTLSDNLRAAVRSANRHRGHPVRTETVEFWTDLLEHAQSLQDEGAVEALEIDTLVAELDGALAERR